MRLLLFGATAATTAAALAMRYVNKTRGPFEPTRYVWSRGLALLCDVHGGVDFIKKQRGGRPAIRFDPARYEIRAGDLVWVRHIALPQFVAEVLPRVRHPFALVTGDEDWGIPSGYSDAHRLLENEHVVRWFTQNYDGTDTSGKVVGIPIGLDFHTISNTRKWGHWPATPTEQEAELDALVSRMPKTGTRELLVHADFHFNKRKKQEWGETRHAVQQLLEENLHVTFQRSKMRRIDSWANKTRYAFVASPHGNGLDCHRTWESLVLGNIPIVRRSSLDPLYDGLPVVIVDDWREITRPNLERWRDQFAPMFDDAAVHERLTNRYWIQFMRNELNEAMRTA